MRIKISRTNKIINGKLQLVSSKSESNRMLMINAVSGLQIQLKNLSSSRDTKTLEHILRTLKKNGENKTVPVYDVGPAGTTMRFLTAYFSCMPGEYVLTGSERMKKRPIKHLVDALRDIGAEIKYLETDGNPPLKINGKILSGGEIEIDGSISSQFTSALLLVAPLFEKGLTLKFKNGLTSKSYVALTVDLLKKYGVEVGLSEERVVVHPGKYRILSDADKVFNVEGDWSSASYLFSLCALAEESEIEILGLKKNSSQPDAACVDIFKQFGVQATFNADGITIKKIADLSPEKFVYDFTLCPDLAQTLALVCAAKKIDAELSGLKTLRVKETDRIKALQKELSKFNVSTETEGDNVLRIFSQQADFSKDGIELETYEDHRMAMSFAPLALVCPGLTIDDANVVDKSYPNFWTDLHDLGMKISD
jgi:3-phosphoshikimate 1-carboxyvinyltransferase